MANIKFLVMDVDGTLTDGKIYMGNTGEVAKAFDIKDGCGILLELPKYNIIPVIITARKSEIVANRCSELKISELHQGVGNKLSKLLEILDKYGESLGSVAYAGDDLPDIPCMEAVKNAGGMVLCPADAIPEIKALADYISPCNAGDGAIRDAIRFLGNHHDNTQTADKIYRMIDWIMSNDFTQAKAGVVYQEEGIVCSIQEYETKDEGDCVIESHRSHIDIQFMIQGRELFEVYSLNCLTGAGVYDADKDAEFWQGGQKETLSVLVPGSIIVVYNGQPHKGAIKYQTKEKVKKLVCKVEI